MKQFQLKTTIQQFDHCKDFCDAFQIGQGDLIITSSHIYRDYFEQFKLPVTVINMRSYGNGEPNDEMVEAMYQDIKDIDYHRVIAIGGGSILDVSKLFALKNISPVLDLFDHKLEFEKCRELILVPTTCGTGSEVTNISILEIVSRHTKLGLAVNELFADYAVLIPELLDKLPFPFFATSSIDAFIHAIESYLSPKASPFTELYSRTAMEMILKGYQTIVSNKMNRKADSLVTNEAADIAPLMEDFLIASTYAGIAFGNAGTAAVHAMSYPLSGMFHVPHGEANYSIFTGVFHMYQQLDPNGKLEQLNQFLSEILHCAADNVYDELEALFNHLIPKKPLSEYGVTKSLIEDFTTTVMEKQGRLMANNYVVLSREQVHQIYETLYE